MKLWISMLTLIISVAAFCIWDGVYTSKIFSTLQTESEYIYETLKISTIEDEDIQKRIINLNDFWTEKMDTLSISISRKDLQPVSDYLQYLCASIKNNSQEDAVTYSRLLNYNIIGLKEITGLSWVNLL